MIGHSYLLGIFWHLRFTNLAIVLFNAVLIGLLWWSVLDRLQVERDDTVRATVTRNNNLAIAFEQYTTRIIENAEATIRDLVREEARSGEGLDLLQFVAEHRVGNEALVGVTLANEHGDARFVAYSATTLSRTNMADRAHFQALRERDPGQVFIGQPVLGPLTGKNVIPITRRISKPDGSFGGMAMVSIEPEIFSDFLRDADLGPQEMISVTGLDGVTRARLKGSIASSGEDINGGPLFVEVRKGHRNGSYLGRGTLDGVYRYFSYRVLPNYELVVTVGAPQAEVMATVEDRRTRYLWAAGATSVVLAAFAMMMMVALATRKRAAAAATLLAAIVESSDAAIIGMDFSGIVTSWNAGAQRHFGFAAAEMIGQPHLRIIPPERQDEEAKFLVKITRGETVRQIETVRLRKDGSPIDVSVTVSAIRDAAGKTVAVSMLARAITERKRADAALQESRDRLALATRSAGIGIWDWDVVANRTTWDSRMYELHGIHEQDFSGAYDAWQAGLHPEDRVRADAAVAAALDGIKDFNIEFRVVWPNGEVRYLEGHALVQRAADGSATRMIGVNFDITARRLAQARINYLNRVYATLSSINALILRVRNRDELLREACRIAVESGGFRMALLGMVDRSLMKIVPVTSAGKEDELVTAIKGLLSSDELASTTMLSRAIRTKEAVVSNDSRDDPQVVLGKKYAESGVRSMAILPLIVGDEAVGAIALYASETEFFHEDELKLLSELAGNIAFAIDHIEKQERLDFIAYHDVLTGLANRTLFLDRLAEYTRAAVAGAHKVALFLIDLERFRNINESLGRAAGDDLLRDMADCLARIAGGTNMLARVGADQFSMVLPVVTQDSDITQFLDKATKAFHDYRFRVNDSEFQIVAKYGISIFPDDGTSAEVLFKNAEAALKNAKSSGHRYLFYTETMNNRVAVKLELENRLRQALEQEEFVLYYQPKVDLATGKVSGAEALIRWKDSRTGLVLPGQFIPVLEEIGMTHDVGRWALRRIIEDCLRWRSVGLAPVRVAVNVSALQLRSPSFVDEIKESIGINPHAAAGLELEITESAIMEDVQSAIAKLRAIRELGVTIAIDDFGTGFSSLGTLSKLPVDTLKIDRSFIIGMTVDSQGLALVSAIINLAQGMGLKVVADGVETEEQSHLLRLLRCDEKQGNLYSRPVPGEIFAAKFLTGQATLPGPASPR